MLKLVALLMFGFCLANGHPTSENAEEAQEAAAPSVSFTLFKKCENQNPLDFLNCAGLKTLRALQKAKTMKDLQLMPGVNFISDEPENVRQAKEIKDEDLPEDATEKIETIYDMLVQEGINFISGRTIKIDMAHMKNEEVGRALEEGRGKIKKMLLPILLAVKAKVITWLFIFTKFVGLLSLKALVVAKLAFILAGVLFFQQIIQKMPIPRVPLTGFGWNSPGSWGTGVGWSGSNQYPYYRSINGVYDRSDPAKLTAQDLAYSKQKNY